MFAVLSKIRRVPATLAFAVMITVAAIGALLPLSLPASAVAGASFAVFTVYCVVRPSKRLDVFFNAGAPGAVGTLLHDFAHISPVWGLVIAPVVLSNLRDIDRADRIQRAAAASSI